MKVLQCRVIVLLFVLLGFSGVAQAEGGPVFQGVERPHSSLVFEFQAYPTGLIPGFTYERFFSKTRSFNYRFGIQIIRHGDEGVQEDERGNGFGGSFGFRQYWPLGFSVGARVDLWFNDLDWRNNIGEADEESGNTDIVVLQPVVEATWRRYFSTDWFIQPSVAAGAEINIFTDGEETGQGFIILGALSIGRSF